MDQWNGQQRALAIEMFYKNDHSLTAAQREFRRFYNLGRHGAVPSKHAIKCWINNFEETGSALKKTFKKPGFNKMERHHTLHGNHWRLYENCSVTV